MDRTFFEQSNNEYLIESNNFINLFFGCTGSCYHTLNKIKIKPLDEEIIIIFDINEYRKEVKISSEIVIRQCIDMEKDYYFNLIINDNIVDTKRYLYGGSIIIKGKCIIIQNKEIIVDH